MSYPSNYRLPEDIPTIITAGHKSARQHAAGVTDAVDLARLFKACHRNFCTASRHDPSKIRKKVNGKEGETLSPEGRRDNFATLLYAAASMCYLASRLRGYADQQGIVDLLSEKETPYHRTDEKGRPQPAVAAAPFYLRHTDGHIHPDIIRWLDATMNGRKEERGRRNRMAAREALKTMFAGTAGEQTVPAPKTPIELISSRPHPSQQAAPGGPDTYIAA